MHECLCPWYGSDQSEEEEDREPDMDAVSRFVEALTGNWDWGSSGAVGIKSYVGEGMLLKEIGFCRVSCLAGSGITG
jgi:hypothetical protein